MSSNDIAQIVGFTIALAGAIAVIVTSRMADRGWRYWTVGILGLTGLFCGFFGAIIYKPWQSSRGVSAERLAIWNIKRLTSNLLIYCSEHEGLMPPKAWRTSVASYDRNSLSYQSPRFDRTPYDYALNRSIQGQDIYTFPQDQVFIFESESNTPDAVGGIELFINRPDVSGANVIFMDTRVKYYRIRGAIDLEW